MNILVAKNGSQLGPFSEDDVRARLSSGEFLPHDLGWYEGLPTWVPLAQLVQPAQPPPSMPAPSPTLAPAPAPYAPAPAPYYAPNPSPYPAPYQQTGTPGWGVPGPANYAGFGLRALAIIIDIILLGIVLGILYVVLGTVIGFQSSGGRLLWKVISNVISYAYFAGMASSASQATVGKMLMGIKVTDANGNRLSFAHSLGRELAKLLSAIPLGLGFVVAIFTERKQALHDLVASCLVLRK